MAAKTISLFDFKASGAMETGGHINVSYCKYQLITKERDRRIGNLFCLLS